MKRSRGLAYYRKRRKTQRAGQRYRMGARALPPSLRGFARISGAYSKRFNAGPHSELKFHDAEIDTPIDFTAEVTGDTGGGANPSLCNIPQGTSDEQRIGRSCIVKSIQARLSFLAVPAASANFSGVVYAYLVQDTQANGALPAVTDVFTGTDLSKAMINVDNSQRFRILKKWVCDFGATAGATTAYNNQSKHIEWYKRCHIPLDFSSTTGATTEIRSNNLVLITGVTPNGSDDDVTIAGTIRLRFADR